MATDQERADLANSLVTLGQGAMKAAMVINGACAGAILAFVGQAWSENFVSAALPSATCAILLFTWGVAAAGFSTPLAYVAQLFYYRATDQSFDEKVQTRTAEIIRHIALLLVLLSFVLFIIGAYQSVAMITNYGAFFPAD